VGLASCRLEERATPDVPVLGVCTPIASVSGTFVVKLFTGNQLAGFVAPRAIVGFSSCSSRPH
jgi:hypothetical protein